MGEVNLETVKEAALSSGFIRKIESVEKYDSGKAREVFRVETLGENFVVYLCENTSDSYEKRFSKEEKLLEIVNERTDIPTQEILLSDFSKEEVPYFFYISKEVGGYNPSERFKTLPREDKKKIVYQAGKYLGELHRNVKFENAGELRNESGEIVSEGIKWIEYLERWTEKWVEKFDDSPFRDLKSKAYEFFEEHSELAEQEENVCLHFDVKQDNIIVDGDEIKAVIDWEKAISGKPEWDLAYSRILLIYRWFEKEEINQEMEKELFKGYFSENSLEDGWRKRLVYYNVIWNFKSLAKFNDFFSDVSEEQRKEEEEFFRDFLDLKFEDLEKATDDELNY